MKKPKILVIEDEYNRRKAMVESLEKIGGYTVFQAADGKGGMRIFVIYSPDVVVIDINISGIRGEELVRWLKKDSCTKTKVIVLGNSNTDSDREKLVRAAGCDEFLRKPFITMQLLEAVRRVRKENCGTEFTCR